MQWRDGATVLVIGLAKSGVAAAELLLARGLRVIVNDQRSPAESDPDVTRLRQLGAQISLGGHPLSLLDAAPDFIVKNPGVPQTVPLVQRALALGIPVYTEIEVASWFTRSPIYAITGSNGKTTTTTLVGEILAESHLDPVVAGNIGRVLAGVVERVQSHQPIVLEVSSFQLLGIDTFHPRIAALLNLYPAHLDYHETFAAYAEAKWRLFMNMDSQDVAVLNFDQPLLRQRAGALRAHVVWFSCREQVAEGVFVRDGRLVLRRDGQDVDVMRQSTVALRGEHNLENACAALAVAVWAGATPAAGEYVLSRFRGIEHRLEFVRSVRGVEYYNDSKATNPEAALRALRSFAGKIIWIAGGLDRGDDVRLMAPEIRRRVRAAVLLGQSAEVLAQLCRQADVPVVEQVKSLDGAVLLAARIAQAGDTVLLSPACASWDMFASFEDRGRMFKDIVHTL